ncbi:MAG: hypothetical protein K6F63_01480 [Lachnospiraceae bacterium]|nr:hypothetical protein [Lachnospiraceae bacterium]
MKKKVLALALALAMVVSATACGNSETTGAVVTATPTPGSVQVTATPTPTATPTTAPVVVKKTSSIDFEDGNYGFASVFAATGKADASTMELADFNGGKAIKVSNVKATMDTFVAFDVFALLGDKAADVASIEVYLWGETPEGKFNSSAGQLIGWFGDGKDKVESTVDWSVYLEKNGAKACTFTVPAGQTFAANTDLFMVSLTDNAAKRDDEANATLFIDDVTFLDKAGNTIPVADTTVAFVGPETESVDYASLYTLTNTVVFPGFVTSGGAWGQNGFDIPKEIMDALVPGTAIEFSFKSEDGSLWIVMPDAVAGWSRCAQGKAYINGGKSIAQITYEQIAAVCGEDKTTWGARMQCEAASAWEVYSAKVGTKVAQPTITNAVTFNDFVTSAGAWGQNGFDMPKEIIDALVPGSAVEITYSSEDGSMWIVMPDATAGWSRCAQGAATCVNGKAYVTYEQIAAVCGADKTTWGARMQCEAASAWEVYGVKVGTLASIPATNSAVSFPDFVTSGGAWGQNGFDMPKEIVEALNPGSYVRIKFTSEDGSMWIVMPDAAAGWSRCAQGAAIIKDGYAYISYEQITSVIGTDKTAWGARMQCEAASAWEVYAVDVVSTVD